MKPSRFAVVLLGLALASCGGEGEREHPEARETPLPAQTPIGAEDVEPPATGVTDATHGVN
jgi:hypothetical protein